jgi:hypothetical protein
MQRGLVMTLAASEKSARERAAGSLMEANADGSRKSPLPGACANVWIDASAAAPVREASKIAARIVHLCPSNPAEAELPGTEMVHRRRVMNDILAACIISAEW